MNPFTPTDVHFTYLYKVSVNHPGFIGSNLLQVIFTYLAVSLNAWLVKSIDRSNGGPEKAFFFLIGQAIVK